jgi:hypothetical protein
MQHVIRFIVLIVLILPQCLVLNCYCQNEVTRPIELADTAAINVAIKKIAELIKDHGEMHWNCH